MVRLSQLALALLLTLLVSGVPALAQSGRGCDDGCEEEQTSHPAGEHSEDEEGGGCCQGSPVCVNCGCCPVRSSAPPSWRGATVSLPRPTRLLVATIVQPILAEPGSDIFHPPRR